MDDRLAKTMIQTISKKLILGMVCTGLIFAGGSSLVMAQDTAKLITERCTECHKADRWEEKKMTEKQWAKTVDQMVRYGAQLNDEEGDLVIQYLTAKSDGTIKEPTTTSSVKSAQQATTTTTAKKADDAQKTTTTTTPPTTAPPTTVTTVAATQVSSPTTPTEQAQTGVEMIWYLLGGGMMVGSGLTLRNRNKNHKD